MAFSYLEIALVPLALLLALYAYGKWMNLHFKRKGIPYYDPPVPFVGIGLNIILQREHLSDIAQRIYSQFPNVKYFGTFEGPRPMLMLKDMDIIKQLCIKDFDVFNGHRTIIDASADPIYGNFMIILKGEKWHDMRSNLSPAFTGSKMKNMFGFVEECAKQMAENYKNKLASENTDVVNIEAKEAYSYFTNDVIATTVFGLKINSMEDPNCEFFKMGKKSTDFGGVQLLKAMVHYFMPTFIMKLVDIPLIGKDVKGYFSNLVLGTMAEREEHGIVRLDMIHLLMEAKKGALKHEASSKEVAGFATVEETNAGGKKAPRQWTDNELVSQALLFYMGGFDTTSTMLTFLMYELARHPDIQKRLQEEIDNFKLESGDLSYNDLPKLKYMDMVVSESMRLWPSLPVSDRVATRDYTVPPHTDSSRTPYQMKANESVWVPIFCIHRDPQYFPNPLKFDPDRFSDENKHSIKSGSYMPFGFGPRNCIGSRFALMVIKAVVFNMLGTFDIVVTSKTQIPVKIATNTFNMNTERGMWVGLKLRTPQ